jgi:hypothetical protein
LSFSLLQFCGHNALAYLKGCHSLSSGCFAPDSHQFTNYNSQIRICTREHCDGGRRGGSVFDQARGWGRLLLTKLGVGWGRYFRHLGRNWGKYFVVQLSFSLLQYFLDNTQALLNGRHSLVSGGFAPDHKQFGKCKLQNRVCTHERCECDGANGGWIFDKA